MRNIRDSGAARAPTARDGAARAVDPDPHGLHGALARPSLAAARLIADLTGERLEAVLQLLEPAGAQGLVGAGEAPTVRLGVVRPAVRPRAPD
jgi:hypothetical protein